MRNERVRVVAAVTVAAVLGSVLGAAAISSVIAQDEQASTPYDVCTAWYVRTQDADAPVLRVVGPNLQFDSPETVPWITSSLDGCDQVNWNLGRPGILSVQELPTPAPVPTASPVP